MRSLMQGRNPDQLFDEMYRNNPQFKNFVDTNRGKSPEQIARENGINPDLLK